MFCPYLWNFESVLVSLSLSFLTCQTGILKAILTSFPNGLKKQIRILQFFKEIGTINFNNV